jgi:hypothetical protein
MLTILKYLPGSNLVLPLPSMTQRGGTSYKNTLIGLPKIFRGISLKKIIFNG